MAKYIAFGLMGLGLIGLGIGIGRFTTLKGFPRFPMITNKLDMVEERMPRQQEKEAMRRKRVIRKRIEERREKFRMERNQEVTPSVTPSVTTP